MTVDDRTDGPSFIFNCNCWIGKGKDDLQKYLVPEKHGEFLIMDRIAIYGQQSVRHPNN